MGGHFKRICREHGTVLAQCRCVGPKTIIEEDCPRNGRCKGTDPCPDCGGKGEVGELVYVKGERSPASLKNIKGCRTCRGTGIITSQVGSAQSVSQPVANTNEQGVAMGKTVKGRFYISSYEVSAYSRDEPQVNVVMKACTRKGTNDNVDWSKYTPSGELKMHVNGPATKFFIENIGKDVYLTLELVDDQHYNGEHAEKSNEAFDEMRNAV